MLELCKQIIVERTDTFQPGFGASKLAKMTDAWHHGQFRLRANGVFQVVSHLDSGDLIRVSPAKVDRRSLTRISQRRQPPTLFEAFPIEQVANR